MSTTYCLVLFLGTALVAYMVATRSEFYKHYLGEGDQLVRKLLNIYNLHIFPSALGNCKKMSTTIVRYSYSLFLLIVFFND